MMLLGEWDCSIPLDCVVGEPCSRQFFSERDLLHEILTEKRAGIYVGIDPTAPSMHVGHMLPFMVLAWGYVWGLPVTFLVSRMMSVGNGGVD